MLSRFREAGLILPTLLSMMGLAVLLWLGTWQLQRKTWKDGLTAQLQARTSAEPISLAQAEGRWRKDNDIEYLRVKARGRFMHKKERYYYAPEARGKGWHVYTPFKVANGRLLMVNRGWIPAKLKSPDSRPRGQVTGDVNIIGLLRKSGEKGFFTPDNELENNIWYWRDLSNMVASTVDKTTVSAYPFFLEVEAAGVTPGGWPKGGATRLKLTNKHLEYVLTWYGLALTLIGVYLAFAWSRLKLARPGS